MPGAQACAVFSPPLVRRTAQCAAPEAAPSPEGVVQGAGNAQARGFRGLCRTARTGSRPRRLSTPDTVQTHEKTPFVDDAREASGDLLPEAPSMRASEAVMFAVRLRNGAAVRLGVRVIPSELPVRCSDRRRVPAFPPFRHFLRWPREARDDFVLPRRHLRARRAFTVAAERITGAEPFSRR